MVVGAVHIRRLWGVAGRGGSLRGLRGVNAGTRGINMLWVYRTALDSTVSPHCGLAYERQLDGSIGE